MLHLIILSAMMSIVAGGAAAQAAPTHVNLDVYEGMEQPGVNGPDYNYHWPDKTDHNYHWPEKTDLNYHWSDKTDLELSKKYDTLYGSPIAPNATPGAAYDYTVRSLDSVQAWFNAGNQGNAFPLDTGSMINDQDVADYNRALAIASERSAVAKLGFDPGKMVSTPPGGAGRVGINGLFKSEPDSIWYDRNMPNAAIHESMHRGIDILRKKGQLPLNRKNEEAYVRALMQKAYGDVELGQYKVPPGMKFNTNTEGYKQSMEGKALSTDPILDQIENIAAQEIARRHPGGPR